MDWLEEFSNVFKGYKLMSQEFKEAGALCWLNEISLKMSPAMGEKGHNFGVLLHGYQGSGKSPLISVLNDIAGAIDLQRMPVTGTGVAKVTTDLDADPYALLYMDESGEFFHSQPKYQQGLKQLIKSIMTGKISGRLFKSYQTSPVISTFCVFTMTSLPWNASLTFKRDDFQDGFMSRLPVVGAGGRPTVAEIKKALRKPPPDPKIESIVEFSKVVYFNPSLGFFVEDGARESYGDCIEKLVDAIPGSQLWQDVMVKQQWHLINVARAKALSRYEVSDFEGYKPTRVEILPEDFVYALGWMNARAGDLIDLWEDCHRPSESFEFTDDRDKVDRLVEILKKWHSSHDILGHGRRVVSNKAEFEALFYEIPSKYEMTPVSAVDIPTRGPPSKRYFLKMRCSDCGKEYNYGEKHRCG